MHDPTPEPAAPPAPRPRGVVAEALAQARATAEALAAEFPDLADDEKAWLDTLEGETDALDVCERFIRRALGRKRLAEGCAAEIRELQARKARFERQQEAAEKVAFAILLAACPPDKRGRIRLERPSFTAAIAQLPPSVLITDEARLPEGFKRRPPPEPDRAAIKAALLARNKALAEAAKQGEEALAAAMTAHPEVPGAVLSNGGQVLRISTR